MSTNSMLETTGNMEVAKKPESVIFTNIRKLKNLRVLLMNEISDINGYVNSMAMLVEEANERARKPWHQQLPNDE